MNNKKSDNQALIPFLKFYNYNSDKLDIENKSNSEIVTLVSNSIISNINSDIDTPESLSQKMFITCFKALDKITVQDEINYRIVESNMPRNFNDKELEIFVTSIDFLMEFIQDCVVKSNKTEEEENDWDDRMVKFGKKFFSSKEVKFEYIQA